MVHGKVGLGERLRGALEQAATGIVEKSVISQGRVFPGRVEVPPAVLSEEEKEKRA